MSIMNNERASTNNTSNENITYTVESLLIHVHDPDENADYSVEIKVTQHSAAPTSRNSNENSSYQSIQSSLTPTPVSSTPYIPRKPLDFTFMQLNDKRIEEIARKVKIQTHYDHLDLSYNQLTDASVPTIMTLIEESNCITKLSIKKNRLTDSGIKKLASLFESSRSLYSLEIEGNDISDDCAQELLALYHSNKAILHLYLYYEPKDPKHRAIQKEIDFLSGKRLAIWRKPFEDTFGYQFKDLERYIKAHRIPLLYTDYYYDSGTYLHQAVKKRPLPIIKFLISQMRARKLTLELYDRWDKTAQSLAEYPEIIQLCGGTELNALNTSLNAFL